MLTKKDLIDIKNTRYFISKNRKEEVKIIYSLNDTINQDTGEHEETLIENGFTTYAVVKNVPLELAQSNGITINKDNTYFIIDMTEELKSIILQGVRIKEVYRTNNAELKYKVVKVLPAGIGYHFNDSSDTWDEEKNIYDRLVLITVREDTSENVEL